MAATISVTAFVDWNSQLYNAAPNRKEGAKSKATFTLERTARMIGRALSVKMPIARFRVLLRLYHGWHKGFEPTENRRAMRTVIAETDFSTLSRFSAVTFSPNVEFGDRLLGALPERIHSNLAIHLPNTLRQQNKGQPPVEKMVDTALAADLLTWARSDPGEWALVLAEDDDLVPPLYVAEAWTRPHGGCALLVRARPSSHKFLKLDGLLTEASK